MVNYALITRETHSTKHWRKPRNYAFAAQEALAALGANELGQVAMSMPIAFNALDASYVPVALLGFQSGKNLLVGLQGQWLGSYVPSALQHYPFSLTMTETGEHALCLAEDSQCIGVHGEGEPFFAQDGQLSPALARVVQAMTDTERHRQACHAPCLALAKHGLIEPWPIVLKNGATEQKLAGLFRVNENALNQVTADALLELRNTGALAMAYCQLLSMQHLPRLGQLADAHNRAQAESEAMSEAMVVAKLAPKGELDLEFLNAGGTIKLGF